MERRIKSLTEINQWFEKNIDCTSHNLPRWILRYHEGEHEQLDVLIKALTKVYLVNHYISGRTRTYENAGELQEGIFNYIDRVRFIIDIESIRRRCKNFNYKPIEIFAFEEPKITILSRDDEMGDMTIDEIIDEHIKAKKG